MKFLFYCLESHDSVPRNKTNLNERYSFILWKPTWLQIVPKKMSWFPFGVWWLFHQARIFSNQDYGIALIYHNGELVHRSCVFPRYFRFPFMGKTDLQIGDTWTSPEYRGQGLATFTLEKIVELYRRPGRQFWYLVESENTPSIRVIEKAGFRKVGEGVRKSRFGIGFLGYYAITHPL